MNPDDLRLLDPPALLNRFPHKRTQFITTLSSNY